MLILPPRTVYADRTYAAVGRALAVAAHFETRVRVAAMRYHLIETTAVSTDPLTEGQLWQELNAVMLTRWNRPIQQHVLMITRYASMPLERATAERILDAARDARNRIAHDSTTWLMLLDHDPQERNALAANLMSWMTDIVWGLAVLELTDRLEAHESPPETPLLLDRMFAVIAWVCSIDYPPETDMLGHGR